MTHPPYLKKDKEEKNEEERERKGRKTKERQEWREGENATCVGKLDNKDRQKRDRGMEGGRECSMYWQVRQ